MKKFIHIFFISILYIGSVNAQEILEPYFCSQNEYFLITSSEQNKGAILQKVDFDKTNEQFVTNGGKPYNAIGYNIKDGFLYGIEQDTKELLKVSLLDGDSVSLGKIEGLPNTSLVAGDFDTNGNFYVLNTRNGSELYQIDIKNKTSKTIKLNPPLKKVYDIAYNSKNDSFYGVESKGKYLYRIYLLEERALVKKVKLEGFSSGEFGASWMMDDGKLLIANNFTVIEDNDDNWEISSVDYLHRTILSYYADGATCFANNQSIKKQKDIEYFIVMELDKKEDKTFINFIVSNPVPSDTKIETNFGFVSIKKGETSGSIEVDTLDSDVYLSKRKELIIVSKIIQDTQYTLENKISKKFIEYDDINDTTILKVTNKKLDNNKQEYFIELSNPSKEDIIVDTSLGKYTIKKGISNLAFTTNIHKEKFKINNISGNNFEVLNIDNNTTQFEVNNKYFIGVNINFGLIDYKTCCSGKEKDQFIYPNILGGYKFSDNILGSIEYNRVDWSNAKLQFIDINGEYFFDDINHDSEKLNYYLGGNIGYVKFKNSTKNTSGTTLGLKAGGIYPIAQYDNLYFEGYGRYQTFNNVKTSLKRLDPTTNQIVCTHSQELKNLMSIGFGVRLFF